MKNLGVILIMCVCFGNVWALTDRHHDSRKRIVREIFLHGNKSDVAQMCMSIIHKDKITEEHIFEYLTNSDLNVNEINQERLKELKDEYASIDSNLNLKTLRTQDGIDKLLEKVDGYLTDKLNNDYPRYLYDEQHIKEQFKHGDLIAFKRSNNTFDDGAFINYGIFKGQVLLDKYVTKEKNPFGANHVSHLAVVTEVIDNAGQKKFQIAELNLSFTYKQNDIRRIDPLLKSAQLAGGEDYRLFRFMAKDNPELEQAVRKAIGNLAYSFTKDYENIPNPNKTRVKKPTTLQNLIYFVAKNIFSQSKNPGKNYSVIKMVKAGFLAKTLKQGSHNFLELEKMATFADSHAALPNELIKVKTFCSLFSFKITIAGLFYAKELFPNHEIPSYYLINPDAVTPAYFYAFLKNDERRMRDGKSSFGFTQIATFEPVDDE